MNAKYLVLLMGQRLIGRTVLTEPMGSYPGGPAKVVEIAPDPEGAPEIVMQVEHPTWREDDNPTGSMGIFHYEDIQEIDGIAATREVIRSLKDANG